MLSDVLGLLFAIAIGSADVSGAGLRALSGSEVTFRPRDRAVSNWRLEAAAHLETSMGTAASILMGRDPAPVTRCVRLNNYWCIKRNGWAGEIAADGEGHVAFASAAEGADVAALLLRRYYVDYARHSALAIVSHWAPASCGSPLASAARIPRPVRIAADHLATRGVGHTLRARWLAARGHRLAGVGRMRLHRSIVAERPLDAPMRAPSIAVGMGEAPLDRNVEALPSSIPLTALLPGSPVVASVPTRVASAALPCTADGQRIQNYAAKAAAGIAASATEDLKLFDPDGRPTPNLARMMHNMSAVEIGPMGANTALIADAVDHASVLAARRAAAAGPATAPPTPLANR